MKRIFNIFFLKWIGIALLFLTLGVPGHPFYVSICEIDHNSEAGTLEITLRVFTDDLETALEENSTERFRLGSEKEFAGADDSIAAYLEQNLGVKVDGVMVNFSYLGKEVELETTWCYLEINGITAVGEIYVKNAVFLAQFEGQTNLIHINIDGQKKSMLLQKGNSDGTLHFE